MGSKDRAECKEPAGGASAQKQGMHNNQCYYDGNRYGNSKAYLNQHGWFEGEPVFFR